MVGERRGRVIRGAAVVVYGALVAFALLSPVAPRVFWTMAMPVLPLAIVLLGVYRWRSACPVAAMGRLGATLAPRRAHRRIPRWLRRQGMAFSLGVLVVCLAIRHVATNGDHFALGLFLSALPLVAVAINARFGGRSFCQYVCPVGVVERIYTDGAPPIAAREAAPSRCTTCVACTSPCIDVDRERAFDRTREEWSRRFATYAFPGVVFGFYAYYALRGGDWEAYFGGAWTRYELTLDHVVGPGFARSLFLLDGLPTVPAALAALLVLGGSGALSFGLFAAVEARGAERERVLAWAAFSAFATFYFFAGAPSLRLVPALERALAFVVPCVATAVLMYRAHRHGWPAPEPARRPSPASGTDVPADLPAQPAAGRLSRRALPVLQE